MSDILRKRAAMQTNAGEVNKYGVSKKKQSNQQRIDAILASARSEAGSLQSRASGDTYHLARGFIEVSTDTAGRKLMSEEEVSSLVHNALRRARQATSSASPRNRSKHSPLSPRMQSTSPTVTSPRPPAATTTSSPRHLTSAAKAEIVLPDEGEMGSPASFPKPRYNTKFEGSDASIESAAEQYNYPSASIENNVSNASVDGSDYNPSRSGMASNLSKEESVSEHTMLVTVNSSDAIIRRVEEEIANARKAAQEANRRLAGVSANYRMRAWSDSQEQNVSQHPVEKMDLPRVPSQDMELPEGPSHEDLAVSMVPSDENLVVRPQPSDGSTGPAIVRNDSDDMQSKYNFAMDVLAEDFDDDVPTGSYRTRSRSIDPLLQKDEGENIEIQEAIETVPAEEGAEVEQLLSEALANPSAEKIEDQPPGSSDSMEVEPSSSSTDWIPGKSRTEQGPQSTKLPSNSSDDWVPIKGEGPEAAELLLLESESMDKERYKSSEEYDDSQTHDSNSRVQRDKEIGQDKEKEPKLVSPKNSSGYSSQFSTHGNIIVRMMGTKEKEQPHSPIQTNVDTTYQTAIDVAGPYREVIDLTQVDNDRSHDSVTQNTPIPEQTNEEFGSTVIKASSSASSTGIEFPLEYDAPEAMPYSFAELKQTVSINEQGIAVSFDIERQESVEMMFNPDGRESNYDSYDAPEESTAPHSDIDQPEEKETGSKDKSTIDVVPVVHETGDFADVEIVPSKSTGAESSVEAYLDTLAKEQSDTPDSVDTIGYNVVPNTLDSREVETPYQPSAGNIMHKNESNTGDMTDHDDLPTFATRDEVDTSYRNLSAEDSVSSNISTTSKHDDGINEETGIEVQQIVDLEDYGEDDTSWNRTILDYRDSNLFEHMTMAKSKKDEHTKDEEYFEHMMAMKVTVEPEDVGETRAEESAGDDDQDRTFDAPVTKAVDVKHVEETRTEESIENVNHGRAIYATVLEGSDDDDDKALSEAPIDAETSRSTHEDKNEGKSEGSLEDKDEQVGAEAIKEREDKVFEPDVSQTPTETSSRFWWTSNDYQIYQNEQKTKINDEVDQEEFNSEKGEATYPNVDSQTVEKEDLPDEKEFPVLSDADQAKAEEEHLPDKKESSVLSDADHAESEEEDLPGEKESPVISDADQAKAEERTCTSEQQLAGTEQKNAKLSAAFKTHSGTPTGTKLPAFPRSNKVHFKQRYPIPPLTTKPRQAEEISKDYRVLPSGDVPFLSKPKPDLHQLLQAVIGSSLQRRSNACGALKVLSKQKKNQLTLVRTAGFLDALVFAITSKISKEDIESAIDARTRAVFVICNVSEPKDNREIVFSHPGLAAALVKVAIEDKLEARASACGALAMLAKTPSNREPMAQTDNLITVLATILLGGKCKFPSDTESVPDSSSSADDDHPVRQCSSSDSESTRSDDSPLSKKEGEVAVPAIMSMREQKNEKTEEIVKRGKLNACAALLHMSKQCGATSEMCNDAKLMGALVGVSQMTNDSTHTKCLEILCNLSRFPANVEHMAKFPGIVDALVSNGGSARYQLDRVWSLRVLQNLSTGTSGKTVLANRVVLELLSFSVMRETLDEQLAATATIYNLSTEPGAVVPLTNTKNVVATLVHVAHNPESSSEVRIMACDALATLGLWLQTLAGAGTLPEEINENVTLPSYITTGWKRWD